MVLKKGTQIASMELLEQDPVINISTAMKNVKLECQNILWDMVSKVRGHISVSEREHSKDIGHTNELQHHIYTAW